MKIAEHNVNTNCILRKVFFVAGMLVLTSLIQAQEHLDSLLMKLDEAIEISHVYIQKREARIKTLTDELKHVQKNSLDEYNINNQLFKEYKPQLKRLSYSQGKLLIKLVDRECNQSSYHLLKAYLGSFRAGFWNFFASMFGASLKAQYDPKGKDKVTERVVVLVEHGLL